MSVHCILVAMILLLLLASMFAAWTKLVKVNRMIAQKGGIRNAYQSAKERADYTILNNISPELIAIVVNSEDQQFFEHKGYSFPGIYIAIKRNFHAKKIIAGGSTITQQLCKNVFLTRERTFKRKILELIIAIKMEKELSKQEILEWYFNILDFEAGIIGISSICKLLFQKQPSQVGVREAMAIAGSLPYPKLRLPGKRLYHYGFKQRIYICFKYGKFFDKDDLDALKAMADRDDPQMEKKYCAASERYCQVKGIKLGCSEK